VSEVAPEPASYRDPHSSVFYVDGAVRRGLTAAAAADWRRLAASPCFDRLCTDGLLVATREVEGPVPPSPRGEPWVAVLEHERIPFLSYPFEWPFAMLRDAARCQLDVLAAALDDGLTTKDGTAYNVQFAGTRPVFIDVGSFEPATGPWPGYRQFCQTQLFPLLVQAHLGIPYQAMLRGRLEGLSPREVSAMFRGRRRWKRGVLRNVTLHAVADRRVSGATEDVKRELRSAGFGVELAKATTRKLRRLVDRLEAGRRGSTAWSDYRSTCSYSEDDAAAKRAFVGTAAAAHAGGIVLDLGANDGAYSLVAAEHARMVVAVDFDEAVVDALYRRLAAAGDTRVLPLVGDLVDPSPGLGWRNAERAPFEQRARDARPALVLALALVHHLALGANVPLREVVRWLADFGAPFVVELPHRDDPMTKRLLANKPAGLFDDYSLERFAALLGERCTIDRRETLPSGTRTLFAGRPR
jgi:hypothetical protein